jgi:hypothetical protein
MWLLQQGICNAPGVYDHPGVVERFGTKAEVMACGRMQAHVDRWNGLRVEHLADGLWISDGVYYTRVAHEEDMP